LILPTLLTVHTLLTLLTIQTLLKLLTLLGALRCSGEKLGPATEGPGVHPGAASLLSALYSLLSDL
jgi:hypothetical protein